MSKFLCITIVFLSHFLLTINVHADEPKYEKISINDLKLDINELSGKKIDVYGSLTIFGDMAILSDPRQAMDMNPIIVETKNLSRDERRYIMENCNMGCNISIQGSIESILFEYGIKAHKIHY